MVTATTVMYTYGHTLSLHDALPISGGHEDPAHDVVSARTRSGDDDHQVDPGQRLHVRRTGSHRVGIGEEDDRGRFDTFAREEGFSLRRSQHIEQRIVPLGLHKDLR